MPTRIGESDIRSVKVGYGEQKKQRISKPVLGVMKGDTFKGLKEFRIETNTELKAGDQSVL
jgi:hypothetical protein